MLFHTWLFNQSVQQGFEPDKTSQQRQVFISHSELHTKDCQDVSWPFSCPISLTVNRWGLTTEQPRLRLARPVFFFFFFFFFFLSEPDCDAFRSTALGIFFLEYCFLLLDANGASLPFLPCRSAVPRVGHAHASLQHRLGLQPLD